ncbi:MAG: hypothetical protein GXO79_10420 [Chlorobi bacterium]|nr:hypothetical protein [Chlorobiota bacterium]
MIKTIKILLSLFSFVIITLLFTYCNSASDKNENTDIITIGTFNIQWLGDGINDLNPRTEADYREIADIIKQTNADILALEEIENNKAVEKLTNYLDNFSYFVSDKSGNQNVAILYKNYIEISNIQEYMPLAVVEHKTRPALTFDCKFKNFDWKMMVVHLKSTSHYDSTEYLKQKSREIRSEQAEIIDNWVDSVLSLNLEKDIIVTGDFNDYPLRKTNATLTPLTSDPNLTFLSQNLVSCKFSYLKTIDQIVISTSALSRYIDNSIREYDFYSTLPKNKAEKISDHCPVVATFNVKKADND